MTPIFPQSAPFKPSKTIFWILFLLVTFGHLLSLTPFDLSPYFSLSLYSIAQGWIWTLVTYPLIAPLLAGLDLFLQLFFDLIFLWLFGSLLIERVTEWRMAVLFFGGALFGGLAALLGLYLWPIPSSFAGLSPVLFALITVWTILHAQRNAHLARLTLRPLWIFLILISIQLFSTILDSNWTRLIANAAGILFGYGFALISERTRSTISLLYPFERLILRSLDRCRPTKEIKTHKIIDFQTGEPILNDEDFMDAMLGKISKYGEAYLSQEEKKRMRHISQTKAKKD